MTSTTRPILARPQRWQPLEVSSAHRTSAAGHATGDSRRARGRGRLGWPHLGDAAARPQGSTVGGDARPLPPAAGEHDRCRSWSTHPGYALRLMRTRWAPVSQRQRGSIEPLLAQPPLMHDRPRLTAVVDDSLPEKQFRLPMTGTHQIGTAIFASAHQITSRFLLHGWHRDRDDLAQVQQSSQKRGIPGVGFDPIPGRTNQLRWRGHQALDPGPFQRSRKPEPGRPGLIGDYHRTWWTLDPLPDLTVIRAQLAAQSLHRCHDPKRTRRPIVRAHPNQHSYADASRGLPYLWLNRPGPTS